MRGSEFIERVLELGRERHVPAYFDPKRGKGSHGTLYFGSRKTIVKDRRKEIGAGLLARMIRQLGLSSDDLSIIRNFRP